MVLLFISHHPQSEQYKANVKFVGCVYFKFPKKDISIVLYTYFQS